MNRQKNVPFVKHHLEKYDGHFPIWVAVELFSFGRLTSLFDIMVPEDQKQIAAIYGTKPGHLKSWLLSLVEVRNICAHYTRLYNLPLKQTPFLYSENRKYRNGSVNKEFSVLLVVRRLFQANEQWQSLFKEISAAIEKYGDVINLSFMGFPENWIEVLSAPVTAVPKSAMKILQNQMEGAASKAGFTSEDDVTEWLTESRRKPEHG